MHQKHEQSKHSHSSHPGHCMHCIMPPHMLETIKMRGDAKQKKMVEAMMKQCEDYRTSRQESMASDAHMPTALIGAGSKPKPQREVYDGLKRATLPGKLVRGEGDKAGKDTEVNQAYDGSGATFEFYRDVFKRDSVDGRGLVLTSTAHYRRNYNNAFWNGQQMVYGDGDGALFKPLTGDLSVIGHELSHGVVQFSGGLIYQDQSGALNEHYADAMGALTQQYKLGQEAREASWLIGADILGDNIKGVALRSMRAPGTAYNDPLLGNDPQPFHMDGYINTTSDNGGVHLNSGIPNQAFYLLCMMLGGKAWEKAGHIWYDTLQSNNNPRATFNDWADKTVEEARNRFGSGSIETILTRRCWKLVGISV